MQNSIHVNDGLVLASGDRFFKTIGEVSAELKISPHVLRFWESKFFAIKPHKRRGGHRYYSNNDIETIVEIKSLLYEKGYTIKGAQRFLKEKKNISLIEREEELNTENHYSNHMQSSLFESTLVKKTANDSPKVINFRNSVLDKIDKKLVMLFIKELESIKNILQEA
ncbi:MAG TPA: MerR family transcriptional regulator [Alphaproteobacteria bacterium]|nr:MerR family transcriptional regulator [Alphaproteobacteria bacterium]